MTDKIVGKALYLELVPKDKSKTNLATQILFTPEGMDESGTYVRMAIHTRTISDWSPRKQWRVSFGRANNQPAVSTGQTLDENVANELATQMLADYTGTLTRQINYEMELRKTPIVVEVSTLDLAEIKDWKTPPALLRRIQKARVALDFPEKVL